VSPDPSPGSRAIRAAVRVAASAAAAEAGGPRPGEPQPAGKAVASQAGALYLIDKSAWEQRRHSAAAADRIDRLAAEGRAATCLVAAMEQLYSARNLADLIARRDSLDLLVWLPATPAVESMALDLMARLARKGLHRLPLPDVLIAATAIVHGAAVLHYDRDFERIAGVTGQPHEWIVPPGSGHGRAPQGPSSRQRR
jgi:predicted nucleic acid-binding protein